MCRGSGAWRKNGVLHSMRIYYYVANLIWLNEVHLVNSGYGVDKAFCKSEAKLKMIFPPMNITNLGKRLYFQKEKKKKDTIFAITLWGYFIILNIGLT